MIFLISFRFPGQMLIDLDKAAAELENWNCGKGFILHGASNIFSSGGDLEMSRNTSTPEMGFAISQFAQGVTSRLRNLPLVSVALIEGVALGGGAEICVAACDWRVMTAQAHIGFVHGRMGLSPGWGGGVALKRLIGPSSALELIASGRLIATPEAVSLGLATAVLHSSSLEVLEQAQQWLLERVTATTEVLRATKALMMNDESEQDLELERRLHAPLWGGKAKSEALAKNIKHK